MSEAIDLASRITVLWRDHSHPEGYQPTLKMLHYPDGKLVLELNVFGRVTVVPYTKAECDCEKGQPNARG